MLHAFATISEFANGSRHRDAVMAAYKKQLANASAGCQLVPSWTGYRLQPLVYKVEANRASL